MRDGFALAMRRATLLTRSGDIAAATRAIRTALAGGIDSRTSETADATDETRPPKRPVLRLVKPPIDSPVDPEAAKEQPAEATRLEQPPRMRKPLGEVLRRLREGNFRLGLAATLPGTIMPGALHARASQPLPEGAQFVSRSFACATGSRIYKLYIPALAADRPRGLIVMLHGCKQNPDDFAAGTNMNAVAETHGLLVAYPAQPASANPSSCWNWFNPADQARGAGEPSIIAGITRELMSEFSLERDEVFVAGLSAGGAMAVVMGETYPELYSAIGTHSGLPYRSANDVMSAFAAMRGDTAPLPRGNPRCTPKPGPTVRSIVFHGSADPTVNPANANKILEAVCQQLGPAKTEAGRAPGGRTYTRSIYPGSNSSPAVEFWMIHGAGHAWSGGHPVGSYTDPTGPNASAEMVRFFLAH